MTQGIFGTGPGGADRTGFSSGAGTSASGTRRAGGPSFATALRQAMVPAAPDSSAPLKFSGHAQERLESRGIDLSPADLDAIQSALGKAEAKGARDTLVLLRDYGFIVSIPNRTVVTAVDREELRNRVFTQLDSTVIAG